MTGTNGFLEWISSLPLKHLYVYIHIQGANEINHHLNTIKKLMEIIKKLKMQKKVVISFNHSSQALGLHTKDGHCHVFRFPGALKIHLDHWT